MFVLFFLAGATFVQFVTLAILSLLVFGVEALNTAIENIVDEVSPHRSDFARRTKDLGSFAVFCCLIITGLYGLSILWTPMIGVWLTPG